MAIPHYNMTEKEFRKLYEMNFDESDKIVRKKKKELRQKKLKTIFK